MPGRPGRRSGEISPETLAIVLGEHPRGPFVDELVQAMEAAARKPNSTIAELNATFGFIDMIKRCPLD